MWYLCVRSVPSRQGLLRDNAYTRRLFETGAQAQVPVDVLSRHFLQNNKYRIRDVQAPKRTHMRSQPVNAHRRSSGHDRCVLAITTYTRMHSLTDQVHICDTSDRVSIE